MSNIVPILKDERNQTPVPTAWRNTFVDIVEAFNEGDFELVRGVTGVLPVSTEDASRIAGNIKGYGNQLTSLPEEVWQTSVCQWMRTHWDVLIDLFTVEEGVSDLVLAVRVRQEGASHTFEIMSVHVP